MPLLREPAIPKPQLTFALGVGHGHCMRPSAVRLASASETSWAAIISEADPEGLPEKLNPTLSIWQLVRSHLDQLNEVWKVQDVNQLLYRTFYYDARP